MRPRQRLARLRARVKPSWGGRAGPRAVRLAALLLQERASVSRVCRWRVRSAGPRAAFPSERGFLPAAGPETPSNAGA